MKFYIEILQNYKWLSAGDILRCEWKHEDFWYICEFAWEHDTFYWYIHFDYARKVDDRYCENIIKAKTILNTARQSREKYILRKQQEEFEKLFNDVFKTNK